MKFSKLASFVATCLAIPCLVNCVASAPANEEREAPSSATASLVSTASASTENVSCSSDLDCAAGQACREGICVDLDGGVEPDGGPDGGVPACSSDADCGPGQACVAGFCQ